MIYPAEHKRALCMNVSLCCKIDAFNCRAVQILTTKTALNLTNLVQPSTKLRYVGLC